MKLKLKQECVDIFISCPFTGQIINTIFLETELYMAYKLKGYDIFEEIVEEDNIPFIEAPEPKIEVKTKKK